MAEIHVAADRDIDAPADTVYRVLSDYREHHPKILPSAFSDLRVESGGVGQGTIFRFRGKTAGWERSFHMRVAEPQPGRVLTESDMESNMVTTFTVEPRGSSSHVTISTRWQDAGGVGGFLERTFAPRMMRRLYADELERLNGYARSLAPA